MRESGMAMPPDNWVIWFRVSRCTYQNRKRLATTPAITMRRPLFWAFSGDRWVVGLITDGKWCWGRAALAPCFLMRWAGVLAMSFIIPPHKLDP
ncbi:hypothetical protein AHiyo1_16980 [Arthrobacter sp. Hiyo1]|nr:hypothetical protein AHiyo1_16980 [Arthrobacter sp. Hiyo1]